jgi:hypothetical protein
MTPRFTDDPWPLLSLRWHFPEFDLAAQVGSHLLERCDEVVADPRALAARGARRRLPRELPALDRVGSPRHFGVAMVRARL